MGKLALVAVRALRGAGGGQEVVAAALRRTLLGVTPFRIRHCGIPFNRTRACLAAVDGTETRLVLDLDLVSQARQSIPTRIRR